MLESKANYHRLGQQSDTHEADLLRREAELATARQKFNLVRYATLGGLVCSIYLFISALLIEPSELKCAQKVSPYSPIWQAVEFWEGDFVNYFNHGTKYRGPPTLALQTAWYNLSNSMGVAIDGAGLAALNKSRPGLRFAESQNSNPGHPMYAATIEVFHQLHCLNLIRQATWPLESFSKSWDYLYPWQLDNSTTGRVHVDHCIETLRQSLMCYSDITPVLAELTDDNNYGFKLDFNVHHKCRNFDKIVDYLQIHGTDVAL